MEELRPTPIAPVPIPIALLVSEINPASVTLLSCILNVLLSNKSTLSDATTLSPLITTPDLSPL